MADQQRRTFLQMLLFLAATHVLGCGGGGSSGGGGGGSTPPPGGGGGTTTVGAATRARVGVATAFYPANGTMFTVAGAASNGMTYSPGQSIQADSATVSAGTNIGWSSTINGSSQQLVA